MPYHALARSREPLAQILRYLLWAAGLAALGCGSDNGTTAGSSAGGVQGAGGDAMNTGNAGAPSSGAGGAGLGSGGSSTGAGGDASGAGGAAGAGGPADASTPKDAGSSGGNTATGKVAAGVRWVGRVDLTDPSKPRFAWGGAGFVAQISGTSVTFAVSNEQDVFFQVVVDHKAGMRLKAKAGMASLPIASGLSAGTHVVEVYRETEGQAGISQFVGLTGAMLMPPPTYSGRMIEFIGDSITAGYGDLGNESHPQCASGTNLCGYTIDTQSEYQDYSSITARNLNADWSIIAKSGWGLARDNGNNTANVLPNVWAGVFFTTKTPAWDFSTKANAVVINLGTNDTAQGPVGMSYQTALAAFVDTIRAKYPDAWLFPITGTMMGMTAHDEIKGYVQAVVSAKGGDAGKIAYVDLGTQDACNCGFHSS